LALSAGTASAPALTTTGDTNTGIFFPAADTIAFAEGGAEVARFDSSGNLGLGVTPSAFNLAGYKAIEVGAVGNLLLGGAYNFASTSNAYNNSGWKYAISGAGATQYEQINGSHNWKIAGNGTAGNTISFTQAMTLDASGNLGVGTTSPVGRLTLQGAAGTNGIKQGLGLIYSNGSQFGALGLNNSSGWPQLMARASAGITFHVNSDLETTGEAARIDPSGNLLVGTTNSALNAGVGVKIRTDLSGRDVSIVSAESTNSAEGFIMYSTGAAAYRFYVGWGGTIHATSTTISAISDIRFKENVRDLDVGLNAIMALKPRLYDWQEGKGADIKNARGFIAQEFEQVFPDLIDEWRDPAPEGEAPYKSVRADLIPVLVKAIQEQQALIQTLTARVAALEGTQP
jgi:hypothetical protein